MVPHSWVLHGLKMFGVADNITDLELNSMPMWKTNQHLGSSLSLSGEASFKETPFSSHRVLPSLQVKD